MSTADLLGTPTGTPEPPLLPHDAERRRLLRAAGFAGIATFLLWVCQPILVATLATADTDVPTLETLESMRWVGTIEVVLFTCIGLCLMVLVLATWRVIRLAEPAASLTSTVGFAMGLVAAAGWLLTAAHSLSMYTSIGAGLGDVTRRADVQAASLQASYLAVTAGLLLFTIGSCGWYVMLATTGRRAGLVGKPLSVVLVALLLGPAYQLGTPFSAPWGLVVFVLGALVLGIAMLVKSRA